MLGTTHHLSTACKRLILIASKGSFSLSRFQLTKFYFVSTYSTQQAIRQQQPHSQSPQPTAATVTGEAIFTMSEYDRLTPPIPSQESIDEASKPDRDLSALEEWKSPSTWTELAYEMFPGKSLKEKLAWTGGTGAFFTVLYKAGWYIVDHETLVMVCFYLAMRWLYLKVGPLVYNWERQETTKEIEALRTVDSQEKDKLRQEIKEHKVFLDYEHVTNAYFDMLRDNVHRELLLKRALHRQAFLDGLRQQLDLAVKREQEAKAQLEASIVKRVLEKLETKFSSDQKFQEQIMEKALAHLFKIPANEFN